MTRPDLAPPTIPVPPAKLRTLVSGRDVGEEEFLETGRSLASAVRTAATNTTIPVTTVVDLGCGCGRVLRHLLDERWDLHGCDVNDELVGWCADHLPGVHVNVTTPGPPLPFDDASVDYVYAFSVFTHFTALEQRAWLAELARIVRPGGVVLLSTHGAAFVDLLPTDAQREQFAAGEIVVLDRSDPRDVWTYARRNAFQPAGTIVEQAGEAFKLVWRREYERNEQTGNRPHDLTLLRRR
jgi:SAM-dependent methyltransferase